MRGEDGDPLDILVIADDALPVGCLVSARLLGVIEAEQSDGGETCRNDRLIATLAESKTYAGVQTIDQPGPAFVDELASFFTTYLESASLIEYTNSWRVMLDDRWWSMPGVTDVTAELQIAQA